MPTRAAIYKFGSHVSIILTAIGLMGGGCVESGHKGKADPSTGPSAAAAQATNAAASGIDTVLAKSAAMPSMPLEGTGWKSLYDGHDLKGWQMSDFGAHGQTRVESGLIVAEMGDALTGVNYTNGDLPTVNYEVALDAIKITGSDFFCGLTFPVKDTFATLVLGGWGGGTVGISSLDGEDASENETSKVMSFDTNQWYRVRLRVTDKKILVWLNQEKIIDVDTTDKKIGLRFGDIELSKPLGMATYQTTAAWRNIQVRKLEDGK